MRVFLPLILLATQAFADGMPEDADAKAARILHEAESHIRELQRLNEADTLLGVQLKIAKKLMECRKTGYPCTGLEFAQPALQNPPDDPSLLPAFELPQLISTYQGRARVRLADGRELEIKAGAQLGPWKIERVSVDSLLLKNPAGDQLSLPIETAP